MLYLKKYFTEGLIQFTILLSLIGVRVDVDTYLSHQLPPLREIILGPSSAYTQTQFHNLRNTLDGYGIHPKSVDLDHFFTTRRLLNQVRQLDRLFVPSTQLSAWLVHRDSETVVSASGQSSPGITLDNGAGLEDVHNPDATPAMRGGSGAPESTYNLNAADSSLGAVAPEGNQEQGPRDGDDDLTKEDIDLIDILWRQDVDLGAGREVFNYSNRQKESQEDKQPSPPESKEAGEEQESWRNGVNLQGAPPPPVDGETGESIPEQLQGLGSQTSPSLQECLRLLEATFPFGEEAEFPAPVVTPEVSVSSEDVPSTSQGVPLAPGGELLAPGGELLAPGGELPLDLEQQWQDIMAIMELQAMEVNSTALLPGSGGVTPAVGPANSGAAGQFGVSARPTPINQDVSLHQASLPGCSQDFPPAFNPPPDGAGAPQRAAMLRLSSSNSSNVNSTFGATNLTGIFLPPHANGSAAAAKKAVRDKQASKFPPPQDFLDKHSSRDERRARAMKIPFSNDKIIHLPVEEFNELLAKHHLSEAQLALIRDIRRRGKNKLAAQNCRKRKLDTIINLEQGVQELRRDKARLLKEKVEFLRSLRQMKQKVQSLYQEVFAQLRDQDGRPYPPSQYSLQYAADGSVLVMPRSAAAAEQGRKPEKKQKDKKK